MSFRFVYKTLICFIVFVIWLTIEQALGQHAAESESNNTSQQETSIQTSLLEHRPVGLKGDLTQDRNTFVCPIECTTAAKKVSTLEKEFYGFSQCVKGCLNGRCVKEVNSFVCLCNPGYAGENCSKILLLSDCKDVAESGSNKSGVYFIFVRSRIGQVPVFCDLNSDGGNWLVIQRRINGSVDFYRDYLEYQQGFGQLEGEFWLGLNMISALTTSKSYQLRVDLEDWDGNTAYAIYSTFIVEDSFQDYRLFIERYNGTAGNAMRYNSNKYFSTKDNDNDENNNNCAESTRSGWWHGSCTNVNLNGKYYRGGVERYKGIYWWHWKNNRYSNKRVEMKIRPN